MNPLLRHILALGLTFLLGPAIAQRSSNPEEAFAFFKVTRIQKMRDTLTAVIKAGRGFGIRVSDKAYAYSVYDGAAKRDSKNIGYGRVLRVHADSSVCQMIMVNPGDPLYAIRPGDLVKVKVAIPPGDHPELLLSLALLDIVFNDMAEKRPFYSLRGVLETGSPKAETEVVSAIMQDLRSTYERYKDVDMGQQMMKPWDKGGRYNDRVPFSLLKDATESDVYAYLQFVASYPGKYMGGTGYTFVETFMTWVINGAPASDLEMHARLFPLLKDPAVFERELSLAKDEVKRLKMVAGYSDSLVSFNESRLQGRIPEYAYYLRRLADASGDTVGKAFLAKALADIETERQNKPAAILLLDTAILLSRQKGLVKPGMKAYLGKADLLGLMGKRNEARAVLKDMDGWMDDMASGMTEEERLSFGIDRLMYEGWIEYKTGDYASALSLYMKALPQTDRIATFQGKSDKAFMSRRAGLILKDQGRYAEASRFLEGAAALYDSLNMASELASAWNDIGDLKYSQGAYREAIGWYGHAARLHGSNGNRNNEGYSYSQTANSLWNLGRIDSAILLHRRAIDMRRGVSPAGVAYSWELLAKLYMKNGFKSEALRAYDSARLIREVLKDTAAIRENLVNVGIVHHMDESFKRAIAYYEKALALSGSPSVEDLFNISQAWENLDLRKSRGYMVQCRDLSASTGNFPMLFDASTSLARISLRMNDLAGARRHRESADSLLSVIGSANRKAVLHRLDAMGFEKSLAFDSAYASYGKALSVFDTTSKLDALYVMNAMGGNLLTRGDLSGARTVYMRANRYARELGSPLAQVASQDALAFLDHQVGELESGLRHTDTMLAILRDNGNLVRYADAMMGRGMLLRSKGDFKSALEHVFYADSVFEAEGLSEARANTMNNAGTVYFYQADYEKAIEYFQRSEPFFRKDIVDDMVLVNRANLAECYYYQKKHREALEILDSYHPIAVKTGQMRMANSLSNLLGKSNLETGDTAKATAYFRECYRYSRESRSAENLIDAMSYLGRIHSLRGNSDSAEHYTRGALRVAIDAGYSVKTWEACYELGMVFYSRKRYDSAIRYFSLAVDIVEGNAGKVYGGEEARKLFTSDPRKVDLYNKIIACFVAVKNPAKASEYALRNSITALNSKYGKDLGFADSTLKADISRAEEFKSRINAVDASIAKAETREKKEELLKRKRILEEGYQNFIEERKEVHRDFDRYMRGGVNPEDLSNYKGDLPDDMAVISYVVNDNQLYKFIVTNGTLEIATTELREDINVLVNEFITALTSPDTATGTGSLKVRAEFADEKTASARPFREVSEKLHELLVSDLLPVIGGKRRLCIIPSGKLSNIPFQCLGRNVSGRFRFMVEDYQVFYANRLDMFRSDATPDRDLSNMAAFGNPDKSLTFAGKEVLDIQKIAKARQVLTEGDATEERARESLAQSKYVHFATHGTLDYVKPRQSYLTFSVSPGGSGDGRLTIAEIDSIKTTGRFAELVTLSACETARPLSVSDDWYVSPANSFLRKKFKSVVASLWKVNDEATGILMNEFYRNLAAMDKVEALQKAQESLSRNPRYAHPYYWGGFVLYGDWR